MTADDTDGSAAETRKRARQCLKAAKMRSDGKTYAQIAGTLDLGSAADAKKCAETGFSLWPHDDLEAARKRAAGRLRHLHLASAAAMTSPEIRELIACLQTELERREEGGEAARA